MLPTTVSCREIFIVKKAELLKIMSSLVLIFISFITFCQVPKQQLPQQQQQVRTIIVPTTKKADTTKPLVAYIPPIQASGTIRRYQFLQNGDFELGTHRNIPGWTIAGRSFRLETGTARDTWEDVAVVPAATIGGDYWKDLKFHTGFRHQKWISSMGEGIAGNPDAMNGAKGTITSVPFKLYPNNNYISFLISGGNNIYDLRIELLEYRISPRISGNITVAGNPAIQGLPGNNRNNNVRTVLDTSLVSIPGISPKTGHNNDIFRRDGWDVQRLDTSKLFVIRITDNAGPYQNRWAHINIDDIRMDTRTLTTYVNATDSSRVQKITIKDLVNNADQQILADYYVPIFGAADLHTHLMSHMAMGNKLLHGAPDVGSILPAGTVYKDAGFDVGETRPDCNPGPIRATSVEQALGGCNATHGGWGTDNNCGNYLRAAILNHAFDAKYVHRVPVERNLHGDHPHEGYPNLLYWPHYSSASHQQMYVDWIRRAYQGGLRVLVTLTVNSELLGGVLSGDAPLDDKSVADRQITEIKSFVRRHNDFMELALDAEDMRRIIRSGKMAIVLGMEVDNIGNFNYANVMANESTVRTEIKRLYDSSVRYIFPIHVVNNKFGGSAIYSMLFNLNNQYTNSRPLPWGTPIPPGLMFRVDRATDPRINYSLRLVNGPTAGAMTAAIVGMRGAFDAISQIPFPPAFDLIKCPQAVLGCIDQFKIVSSLLIPDPSWDIYNSTPGGHVNTQGLTNLGEFAIKEMMKLGMIIDLDHMSEKSVAKTIGIAGDFNYPLMSGHTGMRDGFHEADGAEISENQRSDAQLQKISNSGGMYGVGCSEQTAAGYLRNLRLALAKMGNRAVTMGSDINGFVTMPEPRFDPAIRHDANRYGGNISSNWNRRVNYYNARNPDGLKQYSFGRKTWDYNTEGVAHIGLYPDFYQDLKNLGMTQSERQVFFNAADYFVTMWEKCEVSKKAVR